MELHPLIGRLNLFNLSGMDTKILLCTFIKNVNIMVWIIIIAMCVNLALQLGYRKLGL